MARPLAFLSYARFDDRHGGTQITQFREDLTREIEMHLGEEFRIFQDRNDIEWGTNWKQRIENAIGDVTLFIAMITPSYVKSENCLNELDQFLATATKLGRFDTLLPVYYVDVPALEVAADSGPHGVFDTIRRHQHVDWRHLRHKGNGEERARELAQLAARVRDLVHLYAELLPEPPPRVEPKPKPRPDAQPRCDVYPDDTGDYRSPQEAVDAVGPGTRIVIHEGVYEGGVVMDKPLELVGAGDPTKIVIQAKDCSALQFRTTFGCVTNLTLKQSGEVHSAVDIPQGSLVMTECWIESEGLGIAIHNQEATPLITKCRVHNCRQSGVMVFEQGRGWLQGNDVYESGASGVIIRDRSTPVLQGNRIHHNGNSGVHLDQEGMGELEYNEIYANHQEGVVVGNGSKPKIRRNWLRENGKAGVYYHDGGAGDLDTNEIRDNKNSGIAIRKQGDPRITGNNVFANNGKGVWCSDGAAGRVEGNDLRYNHFGAHWVAKGCATRLSNNRE